MRKMRELHAVYAEHGVMCISEAADLGELSRSSCKKWMQNLLWLGNMKKVEAPEGAEMRPGTVYYAVTGKPFPEIGEPGYGDNISAAGVHELSRRVVKAVNMGMGRDWLVAALFGEAKA